MNEITFSHVQRLTLSGGDRLVLTLGAFATEEALQALQDSLRQEFPDNHVTVLAPGRELTVDRDEDSEKTPPEAILARFQTRCGFCSHLMIAGEDMISKLPVYGWVHEYCIEDALSQLRNGKQAAA